MNRIYAVGIGPGSQEQMTIQARTVLEECQVIIGYTVYVDLLKSSYPDKEFVTTPMRQETRRCHLAFTKACEGQSVAVVCSGDAGVYGMAGLLLQLNPQYPDCQVMVIPGVSAALAGGALLGAPLMHDFAVISLSDLLTPWSIIEKRVYSAAAADLAICLYNPSSVKRHDYLRKICELLMPVVGKERTCGVAINIGRVGEETKVMTLEELCDYQADMFTTVFIGNSQTYKWQKWMVTPRGYDL